MAERVMLALGPFRFEMGHATYQSLAVSQSWRWPEQARIGREPALQFTGREPAEIRLQGVLFPGFDAGLAQVEEMRELADRGEPLQLVDGLGRVWGAWVIVEVGDTRSVLMDDGQPRRIAFELKLKSYGEDNIVTDISGGWSPFAVLLPIIDEVATDPLGALNTVVGDVVQRIAGSMGGSVIQRASVLQDAVRDVMQPLRTALNGAVSRLREAGVTLPAIDALLTSVARASAAPLASYDVMAAQLAALRDDIERARREAERHPQAAELQEVLGSAERALQGLVPAEQETA